MAIIHIIISIAFYFILMLLSVNLVGLLVRGLFINPELEKIKSETEHEFIKKEIEKSESADKKVNIIAVLLIVGYLYITFYFWNIGITIIAIILMIIRLPDLIWEIKNYNGKLSYTNAKSLLPKNTLSTLIGLSYIILLPMLYYFLYHF